MRTIAAPPPAAGPPPLESRRSRADCLACRRVCAAAGGEGGRTAGRENYTLATRQTIKRARGGGGSEGSEPAMAMKPLPLTTTDLACAGRGRFAGTSLCTHTNHSQKAGPLSVARLKMDPTYLQSSRAQPRPRERYQPSWGTCTHFSMRKRNDLTASSVVDCRGTWVPHAVATR